MGYPRSQAELTAKVARGAAVAYKTRLSLLGMPSSRFKQSNEAQQPNIVNIVRPCP